jgi:hypothetical protein
MYILRSIIVIVIGMWILATSFNSQRRRKKYKLLKKIGIVAGYFLFSVGMLLFWKAVG